MKNKYIANAAYIFLALVVLVFAGSFIVYLKIKPQANKTNAQVATSNPVTFNDASTWEFLYSPGMPAKPAASPGGGWYFDFPVHQGDFSVCLNPATVSKCNSVNWVSTRYFQPLTQNNRNAITMDVDITTTGNPVFNRFDTSNGSTVPASARFILYYRYGNGEEYARWWSNPLTMYLKPGRQTLTVPFKPDQWSSVYGKKASDNPTALSWFNDTLSTGGAIGIVFGGGSFFGHGINVSNGTARFTVKNFALTSVASVNTPTYQQSGVVNSASYTNSMSKDSLATVFGKDLTSKNCTSAGNFVDTICDTKVYVNNVAVKLVYASPTQINFLLPSNVGSLAFRVNSSGVDGSKFNINVLDSAPSVYTQNSSGKGLASAQHWNNPKYKNGTPITLTSPFETKNAFILYLTGLGSYRSSLNKKPTVKINNITVPATAINFADKSSTGLDQINITGLDIASFNITSGTKNYPIQVCTSICSQITDLSIKK